MIHRNLLSASLLCLVIFGGESIWAQPGGNPAEFAARMLRRLDRDENGFLDPGELEQSGPLRDYLAQQNVDTSQPVPLDLAADHQTAMFQAMQESRGRGETPGGGGGPGSAGQSGDDKGSRGDRGRSDRGGGSGRSDSGGGRRDASAPGSQPGGKNTKAKVRVGRIGPKASLPPASLPASYAARDVNKDGQIGMYEWSKTDLSTFNRLDTNRDGFLVPAELASPPSKTSVASTTIPGGPPSFGKPAPGVSPSGNSSPATPVAAPATPSGPPADTKTIAAESAFDLLDKDKDGALSMEEYERSRLARKLFTEAKVEIQYPFSKQKFVENYVKLSM